MKSETLLSLPALCSKVLFLMLATTLLLPLRASSATAFSPSALVHAASADNADDPGKQKKNKKKKSKGRNPYARPVRLFKGGQWDAQLSPGLVPTFAMDKAKVKMMPLALGAQYSFNPHFSLGLQTGFSSSESKPKPVGDGFTASWTNNLFQFQIRPGVHLSRIENWDFYGGFAIGLNYSRVKGRSDGSDEFLQEMEGHLGIERRKLSPMFGGFAGARRVISARWSAHTEVGSNFSLLTVGVGYMFGGTPVREARKQS